jgi:hypothetical protein
MGVPNWGPKSGVDFHNCLLKISRDVCYINSTKEHKSCKDQSYYLHLAMQVKMSNGSPLLNRILQLFSVMSNCSTNCGYDHVVLLLALTKLDCNLTSKSWPSSSGLRGCRRTYLTILKRAWSAHYKMVW